MRARLVDPATAAALAGVTERTLRRWTAAGHLPRHGTPRHALYRPGDVVRAADQQRARRVGARRKDHQ